MGRVAGVIGFPLVAVFVNLGDVENDGWLLDKKENRGSERVFEQFALSRLGDTDAFSTMKRRERERQRFYSVEWCCAVFSVFAVFLFLQVVVKLEREKAERERERGFDFLFLKE